MSTETTSEPSIAKLLMKMMLEDRRRWEAKLSKLEAELAEERSRRMEELAAERKKREELAAERRKREADNERLVTEQVEAAVAEKLSMSVLLGTDVPCVRELQQRTRQSDTWKVEEAGVVTQAQMRCQEEEEELAMRQKEATSGAKPGPVLEEETASLESPEGVEPAGLEEEAEEGRADSRDVEEGAVVMRQEVTSGAKLRPVLEEENASSEGPEGVEPDGLEGEAETDEKEGGGEADRAVAEEDVPEDVPEEESQFIWWRDTRMHRWRPRSNQAEAVEVELPRRKRLERQWHKFTSYLAQEGNRKVWGKNSGFTWDGGGGEAVGSKQQECRILPGG